MLERRFASYEELLRAYLELQQYAQHCAVAMASAVHELKTPLAIVSGYLELLSNEKLGPLSPKQREVLTAMQSSSSRIERFLEDFLGYSLLETGKAQARFEPGDLNECLAELYRIWFARFQEQGITLHFAENDRLPEFPFDSHKVQRVVSNLLENAHNCTPPGGAVWLSAELQFWDQRVHPFSEPGADRRRHSLEELNAVRVTVSDTGPGIAPEHHQTIFEDFVSLCPTQGKAHGTGLGLAIARRLVQALKGTIWVESEVGQGSRFSFLLPLNPQ